MLPWVCSVIDHRRRQNVVRTSVTHSAIVSCATFLFLPHFDFICDLLLNRRTATWNLFVNQITRVVTYKIGSLRNDDADGNDAPCKQSLSFVCSILHKSSKIFIEYALHVARIQSRTQA